MPRTLALEAKSPPEVRSATIAITTCEHQRTRCTAIAPDGRRFTMDVGSDAEAESLSRVIKLRGWIKPAFWSGQR